MRKGYSRKKALSFLGLTMAVITIACIFGLWPGWLFDGVGQLL